MNKRTKTITVNGVEVVLHERTVAQVIALADYSESIKADSDESAFVLKSICMLLQSLDYNKRDVTEPSFFDKLFNTDKNKQYVTDIEWNNQFTFANIAGTMPKTEIFKYCAMIQELEGDDNTYYRLRGNELQDDEIKAITEVYLKKKRT